MTILPAIFAAALAISAPSGKTEGTLTVNDKTIAITHAYAVFYDNAEGIEEGPELRVLFSDREIDPSFLEDTSDMGGHMLAREGKLQGVLLNFDPKKDPREVTGVILFNPESAEVMMPSISMSGEKAGFDELTATDAQVKGIAHHESMDESQFTDLARFKYHITFDIPIRKCPPVTEKLTGADAKNSPQAAAVIAFEQAVRDGDIEKAGKLTVESRIAEFKSMIEQMGKDTFLDQARQFIPDAETRKGQVTTVVVRDTRATVIADEGGARAIMPLRKVGDRWIVE